MRVPVLIGVILIVLGVLALAFQGISYVTEETIVEAGPIEIEAERERTIPLPTILGVVALAGGVVLVLVGSRRA
jgi:uncharacterized membrane protein HdeD (DUF308 family)